MEYKIIAMDIDGTLLNMNQEIMPITKEQLISLQTQGVSVVLSSGRDIRSLLELGEKLDMSRYPQSAYICLNGLEIYDSQNHLLYLAEKIKKKEVYYLASIARELHFDFILFFQSTIYVVEYAHTNVVDNYIALNRQERVHELEEIPDELYDDIRKVIFVQKQEYVKTTLPILHQKMDDTYEVTLVEPDWIEINPKGLNKGYALEKLSHIKNIPLSNVIAFGNGENDIEMLKIAGKGIAMGNAFENVKEIADDICDDYNHDGIGRYLIELK